MPLALTARRALAGGAVIGAAAAVALVASGCGSSA